MRLPGAEFGTPTALDDDEIRGLIVRFAHAAAVARETGFDGVQLHAAHSYLISRFLSPRANVRDDDWGGDLGGRSRFLLETVRAVRSAVGGDFPIAVKLNSADFQRDGFGFEDSQTVGGWLDEAGVDLIEISGGTYEQPKASDVEGSERVFDPYVGKAPREREAYFARFAPDMRGRLARAGLMVTGGFRTPQGMADAIAHDGVDLVGLARPLCVNLDAPRALLAGEPTSLAQPDREPRLGPGLLGPRSPVRVVHAINGYGSGAWYGEQVGRMGAGLPSDPTKRFLPALFRALRGEKRRAEALASDGPSDE